MLSVSAAFGNWSIMIILMALFLAMLSHTHTHCAQPLHRSTATYADPYLNPLSFPISSLYRIVLASGQYCVHSLQLFEAQISTLISATRYIGTPSASTNYAVAAAATGASERVTFGAAHL